MRVGDNMTQSLTLLRALLRVQMTALGMWMTRQTSTAKKKKRGAGTVGMAILWVFVGVSFMFMFGSVFGMLAEPFHAMGFDWLYMTLIQKLPYGTKTFRPNTESIVMTEALRTKRLTKSA